MFHGSINLFMSLGEDVFSSWDSDQSEWKMLVSKHALGKICQIKGQTKNSSRRTNRKI